MKIRLLFIFIILSFISSTASAQFGYAHYNYYSVGGKLGYDHFILNMDKNLFGKVTHTSAYSISGSGAFYYSWLFEFHGDFQYSYRTFEYEWDFYPDPEGKAVKTSYYGLSYLSIPLQAKINAIYGDIAKLTFGTGIMPEMRFRPYEEITYQNNTSTVSAKSWLTSGYRVAALAIPVSADLKIYLDKHYTLLFSTTYYYYITKLHKTYFSEAPQILSFRAGFFYEW